jgi:hypothetical protein
MGLPKPSSFGGARAAIRKRNEATREGLATEWHTVQNRQRIGESQPLAALLPRRSEQEELAVDEMDAKDMRMAEVVSRERHVKHMAALRHEREAIQGETAKLRALLEILANAAEFDAVPVRHHEDRALAVAWALGGSGSGGGSAAPGNFVLSGGADSRVRVALTDVMA